MKKPYSLSLLLLTTIAAWAQGPNGTGTYYQTADGLSGQALKTALCTIIKNPDVDSYDQLWTDYKYTDRRDDGLLWDMYSNVTNFVIGGECQGATIHGEGSSYNREHSMPKSWFGSDNDKTLMYSDIMHVVPVDGKTNSTRNNFPYGPNNGDKNHSENYFSKLGTCTINGYTKTVFEPNDEYKGDLARIYFYMLTCYEDLVTTWSSVSNGVDEIFSGNSYTPLNAWAMDMLLQWAKDDPVSQKEIDRNNTVYRIQGNRNPFVDFPGLEEYVWGSKTTTTLQYDNFSGATYGGAVITEDPEPYDPSFATTVSGTQRYEKVDWAGALQPGERYIIVYSPSDITDTDDEAIEGTAMGAATKISANPVREQVAVNITATAPEDAETAATATSVATVSTSVSTTGKPYELVLGGKRGAYTLYDPAARNYLALTSDANQLHTSTDATSEQAQWTIKFSKGEVSIRSKVFDRGIYYNKTSPRFATYGGKSQYVGGIQLFRNLTVEPTGIQHPSSATHHPSPNTHHPYRVFTPQGTLVRQAANYRDALQGLPRGLYIVNGRCVAVP